MSDASLVTLTAREVTLLEDLLLSPGATFAGAAVIIRRKLAMAMRVPVAAIGPDVVTLNTRVRYRVNSARAEERTLMTGNDVPGITMQLNSPRGIALVGAHAGQSVEALRPDGSFETLHVEAVFPQPEAARHPDPALAIVARATPQAEPPKVVALFGAHHPRPALGVREHDESDDPGPSAA